MPFRLKSSRYDAVTSVMAASCRFILCSGIFETTLGFDPMACPIWAAVDAPSCPAMASRNARSFSEMSDSADSTTTSVLRR